jgi:aerobic carbon-monoxide dehydrogenase large subunit
MGKNEAIGTGIGARVLRKEDDRFLQGRGQYVSDMTMPGLREVAFVRSPIAHGRIVEIRKPAGQEESVFVRADLSSVEAVRATLSLPSFKASQYHPLAFEKVRYVGEAIAMCVASSRAEAEDLADLVDIDFEELTPLVDAEVALADRTHLVHEEWEENSFVRVAMDTGLEKVIGQAPVVVEREFRLNRQAMNPLEGKAVLAHWDNRANQLVVYSSTQVPHLIRSALAEHLRIREELVRVIAPDVGGAFGYKCVLQPEELCVAWLALTFKTPFRWVEDRREHLSAGANCREHRYVVKAYADRSGRLLGIDAEIIVDSGAYSVWPFTAGLETMMASRHLPGCYKVPAYRVKSTGVATNKPPIVPYRGVARTGICFAMELMIDAVARAVGREPWEVRKDNFVTTAEMPFTTITGNILDSGDYARLLDMVRERIDVPKVRRLQADNSDPDVVIGVGFANYTEMSAHGTAPFAAAGFPFVPGYEQAAIRLTPDGGLEIRSGVHSHGQGMETSLAQIAHQLLGIPIDRIAIVLGDTALTPYSTGTFASRSITMAGGAVSRGCKKLLDRIVVIAAHLLQCKPGEISLRDGKLYGPAGDVDVGQIAITWYRHPDRLPAAVDPGGMEVTEGFKPKTDTGQYSYGTHAAVVKVNVRLGTVEFLDYVIGHDCGTVINPLIVDGQTIGGTAQGIGTALFEEMPFDSNGQPLAITLADYMLPGASDMPTLNLCHLETPSPNTEFGMKGAGEGGAIPPPAAIVNAINDALRGLGVEINEVPATPRRILHALLSRPEDRKPT